MLWPSLLIAAGAVALSLIIQIAIASRWTGKTEERVKSAEVQIVRNQNDYEVDQKNHREVHGVLFEQIRTHEQTDHAHAQDTDMHWNKREREWLNKRFDIIESLLKQKNGA